MKRNYIFKKLTFLLAVLLFSGTLWGQSTANYTFAAATNGSLEDMSAGTTVLLTTSSVTGDFASPLADIGFPFVFMGTPYTQFSVNSNGLMRLGSSAVSNAYDNNLTAIANMPQLTAFWDDLNNTNTFSSIVQYKVIGATPNRVLVVEWKDFVIVYNANVAGPGSTWQILLHENGKIEYRYGNMIIQGGSTVGASIGFASENLDNKVLSVTNIATPAVTTLTASVTNNLVNISTVGPIAGLHSDANGSRVVYSFTPPAACTAPSSLTITDVSAGGMTLNWVDNATNELSYYIFRSTDGVNYTSVASLAADAVTYAATGLNPGTTYHWRIAAVNEGSISEYLSGSQITNPPGSITSIASGNWNDAATWSTNTVPTIVDNVTIAAGHTIKVNAAAATFNIVVNGTLAFEPYELVTNNIGIGSTGAVNLDIEGTAAKITTKGNFINDGSFNFFVSATQVGSIVFTGSDSQALTCGASSLTNLGNVEVNKPSIESIVEIVTAGTFAIKSGATTGFLTHTSGTLKLSGNVAITNSIYTTASYNIPATGGLWINNPNFVVVPLTGSPTNRGLFRLTAGTYNVGTAAGNSMGANSGAIFTIEGGILNIAGRLQTTSAVTLNFSDGVINVCTVGNTSGSASFGLTSSSNIINMSGGTINISNRSTASTPLDYYVLGSNINITGGTLNIGSEATATNFNFFIRGVVPNLVIDNTTNPKFVSLRGVTSVYGNTTINTGDTLFCMDATYQIYGNPNQPGHVINNGCIVNTSSTGTNRFSFIGTNGSQTLSGTGTIGTTNIPFAGINIANADGVSITSPIITNRVNLFNGLVTGSGLITLGNGGTSATLVQKGGDASLLPGNFDVAPVFNHGTTYSVLYSNASGNYSTGLELPASISGTLTLSTSVEVSLSGAKSVNSLALSATNTGKLITTDANLLTVAGTASTNVNVANGNSGFVNGPLAVTLPAGIVSDTIYSMPLGKSGYNMMRLVNPLTNEGGPVVVKAEVFDAATGGTAGYSIQAGSLGNRYWLAEILSGQANFTSSAIEVTQASPVLVPENAIAKSATLTGAYDLITTDPAGESTITSDPVSTLGYFAIGIKELPQTYVSSTSSHPTTDITIEGTIDQVILKVEVVTTGNFNPLLVSNIQFSTNGTTNAADITNARLYYTGTNDEFATTSLVGANIPTPSGEFNINPNQLLADGINYFWLVYDISNTATNLNVVDAEVLSITVGGVAKTPTVTAPDGNRVIRTRLAGTYTVGVGGNYTTITAAVSDLNSLGVKDQTTLSLIDAAYDVNETFPIILGEVAGTSNSDFILIKPAETIDAVVTANSVNPVFVILADFVMIDGSNSENGTTRNLSFINQGTGSASGAIFSQDNMFVSISNVICKTGATNASYGIVFSGTNYGAASNCQVSKGLIGIQAQSLSNNIFIEGNEVGSTEATDKIHSNAIVVLNSTNFSVEGNMINGVSSATSASGLGIVISGTCSNGLINGNKISDIKNTSTTGWGAAGIQLGSTTIPANIMVSNNLISDVAAYGYSGWTPSDNGYGMVVNAGGGYSILHNTVVLNNNQLGSTGGNTAAILVTSGASTPASLTIKNNIFVSTQTTGTNYAIYSGATNAVYASIDNNTYTAADGIGYIGGSVKATLADWQIASGQDVNSLDILPVFTSATNFSPMVNANCGFDNKGAATGISEDIDGNPRSATTPDIGAYEFESVPLAAPVAENETACSNAVIPPLTATTIGVAKWYSDEALTTLVYTGNTYETGLTAAGTHVFYVTDNNGTCVSPATTVSLILYEAPGNPSAPTGPTTVVSIENAQYTVTAVAGATYYEWTLLPANAGTVSGSSTTGSVVWNQSYTGNATISVKAFNNNCESLASPTLSITVNGPLLTLVANPAAGGNVSGGGNYAVGASVPVSTTTNTGYQFVNWTNASGQVVSTQASFNFTMPAAHTTLTANFNTVYTVTYSVVGGNGSLSATVNGTAISSGSSVVAGSDVVFTATPTSGYKVKEWKVNGTVVSGNISNNYTVEEIAANTTVSVEFELITYTLTFIVKATDNTLLEGASISINSETIVTNASGEATIDLAPGTYDYTVSLQDYLEVAGNVTITNANATENVEMSHIGIVEGDFAQFSVYPNPFSNEITISNPQIVKSVSISAINGQVLSIIETEGKASINTENLPVGMYLITIESHNGERFISKMVKN